jgi:hypothetical protein
MGENDNLFTFSYVCYKHPLFSEILLTVFLRDQGSYHAPGFTREKAEIIPSISCCQKRKKERKALKLSGLKMKSNESKSSVLSLQDYSTLCDLLHYTFLNPSLPSHRHRLINPLGFG